jgi:hypothetical protein
MPTDCWKTWSPKEYIDIIPTIILSTISSKLKAAVGKLSIS